MPATKPPETRDPWLASVVFEAIWERDLRINELKWDGNPESQESLTNVGRHSEASHVQVSLRVERGNVDLEVFDNGRGITADEAEGSASLGLIGVRERAWAFGGEVTIEGAPAAGTRLWVRFPYKV